MNRFTPYSRKLTQFDTMRPFRRSDKALNNIEPKSYGDGYIDGHGDGHGDGHSYSDMAVMATTMAKTPRLRSHQRIVTHTHGQ